MSYGIFQMGQNTADQALAEEQFNRQNEQRREQVNNQLEQAEINQKGSMIGTGAAIGMYAGPVGALVGAGVGFLVSELF